MKEKIFDFLCGIVIQRPRLVLFLSITLAVLSLLYTIQHLTFLPQFSGLSKEDAEYNKNYNAFVKEFHIQPDMVVVVKSPSPSLNTHYLETLAFALSQEPSISRIYYKVNLRPFKAWALAYPSYSELEKIEKSVHNAKSFLKTIGYRPDLEQFWLTVSRLGKGESPRKLEGDVQDFSLLIELTNLMKNYLEGGKPSPSSFQRIFQGLNGIPKDHYLTLNQGEYALLFARPSDDTQLELSVRVVRRTAQSLAASFPGLEVHLTGEPVLAVDEMDSAKHDIFWAGLFSLVLGSLILIFGFREWRNPCLAVVTLLVGIGWSLGYITFAVKHMNVFTLSLFPMLIGLALDFSVQFLGRYQEELSREPSPEAAIRRTYFSTGTGLLTAAVTTSLGFYAISFTTYRGIVELGLATGGSLLLCFLSTMTVLPALLFWGSSRQEILAQSRGIAPLLGKKTERFLWRHWVAILFFSFLFTFYFGRKARQIRFDHNVLHLQSKNLDSIKTELDLIHAANRSSLFAVMVADSQAQARLYVNQLSALSTVKSVQSIFPMIPTEQKRKLPIFQKIRREFRNFSILKPEKPVNVQVLEKALQETKKMVYSSQRKIGYAVSGLDLLKLFLFPASNLVPHKTPDVYLAKLHDALAGFQQSISSLLFTLHRTDSAAAGNLLTNFQMEFYRKLKESFDLLKHGIPNRPMTVQDIPRDIRNQFVGKTGKMMIQIFPSQNIWERPALERFVGELREVDPKVTGAPILIYESTKLIFQSYQQAAKVALVVILLAVLLQFRNLKYTFFALFPLGVGLLWLLGITVLSRKAFNPANLLTLPVILGIGVAFGVYVVTRYREEKHASIFSTSTGRSVLLSALTSIAGFATLLGVSHQGLQSLGFTMTVGLSAITIQALFVLPLLLNLWDRKFSPLFFRRRF